MGRGRPLSVQQASSAQEAVIDYVRSLGCAIDEMTRLGVDSVAWRGAVFSAAPASDGRTGRRAP